MIVTKFHENRSTIDRKILEKHAILVDHFYCDFGYSEDYTSNALCELQAEKWIFLNDGYREKIP